MRLIAVLLCGALAACSQTTSNETASVAAQPDAKSNAQQTAPKAQYASADRCAEAARKMQQQATNSAMLGGALSMVGGIAGFGGRGGAIAGQAVSMGGSLVQAKARNDARSTMEEECMP
jgi:hypothetical protein